MHAVVLHTFGPAENLRYETVPDPVPGPGQVRIAVAAAGVHAIEAVMRSGRKNVLAPPTPPLPAIFGGEVSGTVESVGEGVDPSWAGRGVVTRHGAPGGYAELAVADVTELHPRPEALSDETAVAMIVTGATALAFLDVARLTEDDVLLVTSAAGGIGRLVVQYARARGIRTVGAAGGTVKVAAVRALGADLAVDYDEPGWEKTVAEALGGRRVTVVLDGVGGDKARAAFGLLAPGGRFVSMGSISTVTFAPSPEELAAHEVTFVDALSLLLARPEDTPALERRALEAAADGSLVPAVQTFALAQAATAHAALEKRETTGKVVLVP
ncbi:zinc-binding dehydrogenase [Streptomyces sp. NPDC054796]